MTWAVDMSCFHVDRRKERLPALNRSREEMYAAFGFVHGEDSWPIEPALYEQMEIQEKPPLFEAVRASEIAYCKSCGRPFPIAAGHDCPGITFGGGRQGGKTASLSEREIAFAGGRQPMLYAMLGAKAKHQSTERPMPEPTEAEIREGYRFLTMDQLREVAGNEGERQVVRDVARAMLDEGYAGVERTSPDATDEQTWRANYAGHTNDQLRDIVEGNGDSLIDSRDWAQAVLAEREEKSQADHQRLVDQQEAEWQAQVAERQAEREKAMAVVDNEPAPGKPDPVASSENHAAAIRFAARLTAAGLVTGVAQTRAVQGRPVKDGWAVNVHDGDNEIGFVACWWGRAHFLAYAEVAGHRERTDEAADLLLALLHRAREHEAERGE